MCIFFIVYFLLFTVSCFLKETAVFVFVFEKKKQTAEKKQETVNSTLKEHKTSSKKEAIFKRAPVFHLKHRSYAPVFQRAYYLHRTLYATGVVVYNVSVHFCFDLSKQKES
jgi:hypothetical protein